MQLARHHITHLLNALYTEGITSVSVRHPCEEIGELLEIDLSDPVATTVRFTQGALTYQDSREELHTTYDEQAYDDLPDKDTYIRALVWRPRRHRKSRGRGDVLPPTGVSRP